MQNNSMRKYLPPIGLAIVFIFSIMFGTASFDFIPLETIKNIWAMIQVAFFSVFDSGFNPDTITDSLPFYSQTVARIKMSLISLFAGVAICFAGATYQTVFKNPIASPNMLGVSTGVSLGNMLFIVAFQASAYNNLEYRYLYCYGLTAVLLGLIMLAGKISGKKMGGFSVETIIILGMMLNQLGSVFTTYFRYLIESDETGLAEMLTMLTSGNVLYVDTMSFVVFVIAMLVSTVPMFLIRYRFNLVAFDDAEVSTMGISNSKLRFIGLVCGGIMATAAVIHCGDVGFLSMVIPFMCRTKLHADFREVVFMSTCLGGILSLLSRFVYEFTFNTLPFVVPAGDILTLIVLPIFVYSLLKRESAFA